MGTFWETFVLKVLIGYITIPLAISLIITALMFVPMLLVGCLANWWTFSFAWHIACAILGILYYIVFAIIYIINRFG